MLDMKRREFVALAGGAGLLLAVKVRRTRAQQPAMPVIDSSTPSAERDFSRDSSVQSPRK